MILTRYTLKHISKEKGIVLPTSSEFDLPEKVLQFGTGVSLRAVADYFIDKANKKGLFNGRIVAVNSTGNANSSSFEKQDNLYTVCERGTEQGNKVETNLVNASISRVLNADTEWGKVLQCARNPEIRVVISNTTEVGIRFLQDDIWTSPPLSFPGKLLSVLYERFKTFNGSDESGVVIVPTELIPDNGKKLESLILELAHLNGLEATFMDWLENSNHFCNSLVDRIVPGRPVKAQQSRIEKQLTYQDDLLIVAEAYKLWAIESSSEKVRNILSFSGADEAVQIVPDITKLRELKLRLLNGTHTLSCGLAVLGGSNNVKAAMGDEHILGYMQELISNDIIPSITNESISEAEATSFAMAMLDRFRNPYLDHRWLSISLQYSSKMKMRILPLLFQSYERFNAVPEYITLGFAAYLLFMKVEPVQNNRFRGNIKGSIYFVQDDKAAYFAEKWQDTTVDVLVEDVLGDQSLWGTDLTELEGFSPAVKSKLKMLMQDHPGAIYQMLTAKKALQS